LEDWDSELDWDCCSFWLFWFWFSLFWFWFCSLLPEWVLLGLPLCLPLFLCPEPEPDFLPEPDPFLPEPDPFLPEPDPFLPEPEPFLPDPPPVVPVVLVELAEDSASLVVVVSLVLVLSLVLLASAVAVAVAELVAVLPLPDVPSACRLALWGCLHASLISPFVAGLSVWQTSRAVGLSWAPLSK
jgi:hypothetical protein